MIGELQMFFEAEKHNGLRAKQFAGTVDCI